MPEFGNYQNITCVKCRSSENAKTKRMLNAEARETSKQMVGDFPGLGKRQNKRWETFPGLGKRPGKQRDKKQETCFNHLIKKGIYYGKRK